MNAQLIYRLPHAAIIELRISTNIRIKNEREFVYSAFIRYSMIKIASNFS